MSGRSSKVALGFRPTHRLPVASDPVTLVARVKARLASSSPRLEGRWAGPSAMLALAPEERHLWSPWVVLDIRPGDGSPDAPVADARSSTVIVRFSPHPSLWALLTLTYLMLASAALFAACFGWAQLVLDQPAWAWWIVGGAALSALLLWVCAQAGQALAREQMDTLWAILDRAISDDCDDPNLSQEHASPA